MEPSNLCGEEPSSQLHVAELKLSRHVVELKELLPEAEHNHNSLPVVVHNLCAVGHNRCAVAPSSLLHAVELKPSLHVVEPSNLLHEELLSHREALLSHKEELLNQPVEPLNQHEELHNQRGELLRPNVVPQHSAVPHLLREVEPRLSGVLPARHNGAVEADQLNQVKYP